MNTKGKKAFKIFKIMQVQLEESTDTKYRNILKEHKKHLLLLENVIQQQSQAKAKLR